MHTKRKNHIQYNSLTSTKGNKSKGVVYMDNKMNNFCEKSVCCIEGTGTSIDPRDVCGTIPAGTVSSDNFDNSCMLAQIYFPSQTYMAGFTPDAALQQGTLYPELVRFYK